MEQGMNEKEVKYLKCLFYSLLFYSVSLRSARTRFRLFLGPRGRNEGV